MNTKKDDHFSGVDAATETREMIISDTSDSLATAHVPVAALSEIRVDMDVLEELNKLLSTQMFHIYAKVGSVTCKVKSLHVNPHSTDYVDLLVADELEDIKITMLWSVKLVCYVGQRRWLW